MQDYASGSKRHVRVFANISAIKQFMPGELSDLLNDNSQVKIHLEEHVSSASKPCVAFAETIGYDYVGLPAGCQVNKRLIRAARELGEP